MIKYSELTDEQKIKICNGCGAKGGLLNPPEFLFHASCNQHDFYYWRGGTEEDRFKADTEFYRYMLLDVDNEKNKIKRKVYKMWAYLYYRAVRVFGKRYFNYDRQRSHIDLELL